MSERALGKMLVGNMIVTAAGRAPDATSFVCTGTGRRFTFRQTNERCNRLAHALMGMGLSRGDVVAFVCSNRAEIAEIYFALAKSGIVGIPLNYRLAAAEMIELMRSMGALGLIYEGRFEAEAAQVRAALAGVTRYVCIGDSPAPLGPRYEDVLAAASPVEPQVEVDEADPYYYNLTSGTTGLPKSYVLTQYNNSASIMFGSAFDVGRKDVVMTVFPMFGRVGVAWIITSVTNCIPNVLANFEPSSVLALIEKERVTAVNLVATMAAMLLACDKLGSTDLSSLRAVVFAGSMLPAPIREQTMARICRGLYEYYGMQETGLLVHSTPEDRAERPDSIGKPTLYAEVRVVDAQDRPLPAGEIGEIIGRSPCTVTSYFQNPAKSAETFRNGWVHTGDLGMFDDQGFLFIRGRIKDMIITGGQNVHAAEVEETILRHPAVADCAVIGLPDDFWGERVAAVVVPREGAQAAGEELENFCRQTLAGFKTPKQFLMQPDPLPRTPTGKVQKFLLVDRYR